MFIRGTILLSAVFLIVTFDIVDSIAQTGLPREIRRSGATEEEIVSISSSVGFTDAIVIFNELSKKYLGKVIISELDSKDAIGVDINQQYWLDALEKILYFNDLWYRENEDYLMVYSKKDAADESAVVTVDTVGILFGAREVKISAVFFEANDSKLRQIGFNWKFFNLGNDSVSMNAAGDESSILDINITEKIKFGDGFDYGSVVSVFKTLESNQLGDIIANPQVTVLSGEEGTVQIGSDFSITIKDYAGNAITSFFSTGSIIKVKPQVMVQDSLIFIYLKLDVEKSSAIVSETSTEIKKTTANTSILLLDGEETIIGGLYSNEVAHSREGIPILKDLPWWFFGLKYLFGYESSSLGRKELIILLKAELLPSLMERSLMRIQSGGGKFDAKSFMDKQKKEFDKLIKENRDK